MEIAYAIVDAIAEERAGGQPAPVDLSSPADQATIETALESVAAPSSPELTRLRELLRLMTPHRHH